jgi:hypothetical protein
MVPLRRREHEGCLGRGFSIINESLTLRKACPPTTLLMQVDRPLQAPILDAQMSPGQRYFVLGQSAQAQADASAVSHGVIAATQLDGLGHVRGDKKPGAGDSGGGCFAVDTGRLIGMVVGADHITEKAVLVPCSIIQYALRKIAQG